MKLMSSSPGMGWAVTLVGVSVVPAIVIFSHGRKKMTRPSLVAGSSRPMLSGLTSQRGRKFKKVLLLFLLTDFLT